MENENRAILDLASKTKQNTYKELRAMLNYAVKLDYLAQNPILKLGNFKATLEQDKPLQYYTADQFKKYIAVALKHAEQTRYYDFYIFFCLAYYTGARKGEIHALRWSDIKDNRLYITKSINQKLKGGDRETPPKNKGSIRDIKLPKPLIKELTDHKKRQQEHQKESWSESNYICGTTKPLRDTSIDVKNRSYAKQAELHNIRIHDFRHSHASILIDGGIAITEIARRLGHSDIKETLNTYAHFFPKQEEKAIEILNNI